ncbi:MAG: tatB [Proteobacteria bacterium]|nr:tatB [Pseudomonadota bacterium]
MFDVGFWEIALIGLIALLVFGPERLPRVAREAALWIRKMRQMASSVRDEISHELELQDLKQSMLERKKQIQSSLEETIEVLPRQSEKLPTERNGAQDDEPY